MLVNLFENVPKPESYVTDLQLQLIALEIPLQDSSGKLSDLLDAKSEKSGYSLAFLEAKKERLSYINTLTTASAYHGHIDDEYKAVAFAAAHAAHNNYIEYGIPYHPAISLAREAVAAFTGVSPVTGDVAPLMSSTGATSRPYFAGKNALSLAVRAVVLHRLWSRDALYISQTQEFQESCISVATKVEERFLS